MSKPIFLLVIRPGGYGLSWQMCFNRPPTLKEILKLLESNFLGPFHLACISTLMEHGIPETYQMHSKGIGLEREGVYLRLINYYELEFICPQNGIQEN